MTRLKLFWISWNTSNSCGRLSREFENMGSRYSHDFWVETQSSRISLMRFSLAFQSSISPMMCSACWENSRLSIVARCSSIKYSIFSVLIKINVSKRFLNGIVSSSVFSHSSLMRINISSCRLSTNASSMTVFIFAANFCI